MQYGKSRIAFAGVALSLFLMAVPQQLCGIDVNRSGKWYIPETLDDSEPIRGVIYLINEKWYGSWEMRNMAVNAKVVLMTGGSMTYPPSELGPARMAQIKNAVRTAQGFSRGGWDLWNEVITGTPANYLQITTMYGLNTWWSVENTTLSTSMEQYRFPTLYVSGSIDLTRVGGITRAVQKIRKQADGVWTTWTEYGIGHGGNARNIEGLYAAYFEGLIAQRVKGTVVSGQKPAVSAITVNDGWFVDFDIDTAQTYTFGHALRNPRMYSLSQIPSGKTPRDYVWFPSQKAAAAFCNYNNAFDPNKPTTGPELAVIQHMHTLARGTAYAAKKYQVINAQGPVSASVVGGTVPPGLTLDRGCFWKGTPTQNGNYEVVFEVTDGKSTTRQTQLLRVRDTEAADFGECPIVTVTSPVSRSQFRTGSSITFTGTATDVEDGDVSSKARWYSHIDGFLGEGKSITTNRLAAGTHEIHMVVKDKDWEMGGASIAVTVLGTVGTVLHSPAAGNALRVLCRPDGLIVGLPGVSDDVHVSISDLSGRTVAESSLPSVSTTSIAGGTYVVRVRYGNSMMQRKVLIR